jgi:saposin
MKAFAVLLVLGLALTCSYAAKPQEKIDSCAICQFVVGYIEGELGNNRTEENIIQTVEKVCTFVPSILQAECNALIATYGPQLIQSLINDEPPEVMCAQIGLCTSETVVDPQLDTCSLCEFVVGYVESELDANATEAQIEAVLDSVCSLVPSTLRPECTAFINTYFDQLVQLLINEESPEIACAQLKLCTSVAVTPAKLTGEECVICEYVLSTADQYLTGNETEQQLILFVENICYILPSTIRGECDALISTYAPEIVQMLVQDYPPDVVCTSIGLCSSVAQPLITLN